MTDLKNARLEEKIAKIWVIQHLNWWLWIFSARNLDKAQTNAISTFSFCLWSNLCLKYCSNLPEIKTETCSNLPEICQWTCSNFARNMLEHCPNSDALENSFARTRLGSKILPLVFARTRLCPKILPLVFARTRTSTLVPNSSTNVSKAVTTTTVLQIYTVSTKLSHLQF